MRDETCRAFGNQFSYVVECARGEHCDLFYEHRFSVVESTELGTLLHVTGYEHFLSQSAKVSSTKETPPEES